MGYEGNKAISIPGIVVGIIFLLLAVYTWSFSYLQKGGDKILLKLPYRSKVKINQMTLLSSWRNFQVYQLKSDYQSYSGHFQISFQPGYRFGNRFGYRPFQSHAERLFQRFASLNSCIRDG